MGVPEWGMRLLIVVVLCGFPIAFALAWMIDFRSEGLLFDRPFWRGASGDEAPATAADFALGVLLLATMGALTYGLVVSLGDMLYREPPPPETAIQDYFASGLAEEILNLLATVPELRVAARTSSFRFRGEQVDIREVAELLNVRHVLEGSVRPKGDRVRVTAQLIDGTEGYHDWSKAYDRELNDIFSIQDEIATAVVNELRLALGVDSATPPRQQSTEDIDAYLFYLRGREAFYSSLDRDVMLTARDFYQQALTIDPKFARAWAGVCETELRLYDIDNDPETFDSAERACRRATDIDPDLYYEVGVALAKLYRYRGLYPQAEQAVRELVAANPAGVDAYIELGNVLLSQSREEEAEAYLLKAVDMNRGYWRSWEALANLYYSADRYPKAATAYEMLTRLTPDMASGFAGSGAVYWMMGKTEQAMAAYQQSIQIKPSRQAYTNIGLLHYYRGEFAAAAAMQQQAIDMAPDDHRVWGRFAEASRFIPGDEQLAQRGFEKAAALASENLKVNAEDAVTRAMLGLYLVHQGMLAQAESTMAEAVALAPENPEVLYYRALLEVALDRPEAAIRSITAAYRADADYRIFIESDPDLAALREYRVFTELLSSFR